jgi:hypothetical protein
MSGARSRYIAWLGGFTCPVRNVRERGPMNDVIYIGLTIVVFAVLFLLVRGVERFER